MIRHTSDIDSTAVSIFVVILVELTNTVFVNAINITTNNETAALSTVTGRTDGKWKIEQYSGRPETAKIVFMGSKSDNCRSTLLLF